MLKTAKKDLRRQETSEIKFLKLVIGYTRNNRIRNETITNELRIEPITQQVITHEEKYRNAK